MKLDETVNCLGLKDMSCVGASLCSLHVPSGFAGRPGSEVSTGCVILWGVLATTALVGCMAGVSGARVNSRCEPEPLLCLMFSTPCQEWRQGPRGWSRSPEGVGFLQVVMAVPTLVWGVAGS